MASSHPRDAHLMTRIPTQAQCIHCLRFEEWIVASSQQSTESQSQKPSRAERWKQQQPGSTKAAPRFDKRLIGNDLSEQQRSPSSTNQLNQCNLEEFAGNHSLRRAFVELEAVKSQCNGFLWTVVLPGCSCVHQCCLYFTKSY